MLIKSLAFASVAALLCAAPCNARTLYVAGVGAAASGAICGYTPSAPCATIDVAIGYANAGDTIVCLSTPASSAILIEKSITIDCSAARGESQLEGKSSGGLIVAILINATGSYQSPDGLNRTDYLRTVRLRGLTIDGSQYNTNNGRIYDRGIDIQSAAVVHIEDCIIANVKLQGIYDHRSGGQTKLFVKDTIISGNAGPGIVAASAATSVTVLDNVSLLNNKFGLAAATGNNVVINRSTISGNTTAGVEADPGAQVSVSNSAISHNNIGAQFGGGTIRLLENTIQFNTTAIQGSAISGGGNRFFGNSSQGTTPSLATGAPADVFN